MAKLSWEDRVTIKSLTGRQCSNCHIARRFARVCGAGKCVEGVGCGGAKGAPAPWPLDVARGRAGCVVC